MSASAIPPAAAELSPEERRQRLLLQASPFLLVGEVNELFGGSDRAALERLEAGQLRAIDISLQWPDAGRRELRIYRYSVCHCFMSQAPLAWLSPESILLNATMPIRRAALAALLRCSLRHLGKLAKAGALASRECAGGAAEALRDLLPHSTPQELWRFLEQREVVL